MAKKLVRYVVTYTEDEDDDNKKTFAVWTDKGLRGASNIVSDYIEDNNIHESINYGFSLVAVASMKKADIEIPHEDIPIIS